MKVGPKLSLKPFLHRALHLMFVCSFNDEFRYPNLETLCMYRYSLLFCTRHLSQSTVGWRTRTKVLLAPDWLERGRSDHLKNFSGILITSNFSFSLYLRRGFYYASSGFGRGQIFCSIAE